MVPDVIDAKYIKDYIIWVKFTDGTEGEVDLEDDLHGDIFEPLKNKDYFKKFTIHPELYVLTWPNGADIAPEHLYGKVKIPA
jgi:hypothetical protein